MAKSPKAAAPRAAALRKRISFSEFAHRDFRQFSLYDCQRSIASLVDGMKITQRKVIYSFLLRGENAGEIKVAQAASYVAGDTDYHHGEQGIAGVISKMAQNFPGSNNVIYMEPIGQFGSQLDPTPAAARYIHTKMTKDFRKFFKKADDPIIQFQYSDAQRIEPNYYLPILPMVLINGSDGIGTGFASKVFNYSPKDVRDDVIAALKGKKRKPLTPWYHGWQGTVTEGENPGQYYFHGKITVVNSTTLHISELPIGMYQDDIKKVLIKLSEEGHIKDFDDDSNQEVGININVTVPRTTGYLSEPELLKMFKLTSKDTQNLTLWTENGRLKKFADATEIVDHFTAFRLRKYEERRLAHIKLLNIDLTWLLEKARFIEFYLANTTTFTGKKKADIVAWLNAEGFTQSDRLMNQRIYSLTLEEIEDLLKETDGIRAEIAYLEGTTARDLYLKELTELTV